MKIIVIIIVVAVLVVTCVGTALLAMFGFGIWAMQGAEGAIIQAIAPSNAAVGQAITLRVVVTNELDRQRTIGDIDIQDSFLNGFTVESVEPPESSRSRIFDYTTFTMNAGVPPEGETVVTFTLTPTAPGDYVGDVDVYVDSDVRFDTRTVQTVVTDPR